MLVVYNSFGGRYSDNPRAIHAALLAAGQAISHVWLADPWHERDFPAGVTTVRYGSRRCVEALESADLVISNTYLELDWTKAPTATYVQTWHGTPLKRLHFDVLWSPPGGRDPLSRDVRRWDLLLSPNGASTGPLRDAFGFTGPVVETGYPRNDVLRGASRDRVRARVRRELAIPDGTTVVLYTPTWRDDLVDVDGNQDFALHLDLDEFAGRLGRNHLLLLRLHHLVSRRLGRVDRPGVRDVSGHPDISDLYLAADVMVTDYSSTMFDFAVTGKPMLFYTYDLAHYRDTLRGFYFDFPVQAPGPLLQTSTEVVDAIAELAAVRAQYQEPYTRFQNQFCHLEDGRATTRVLDRVFAVLAGRSAAGVDGRQRHAVGPEIQCGPSTAVAALLP